MWAVWCNEFHDVWITIDSGNHVKSKLLLLLIRLFRNSFAETHLMSRIEVKLT